MAKAELNRETETETKIEVEDSSSLKGTLASVFILGIFLIVTWIGVYSLFLDRS